MPRLPTGAVIVLVAGALFLFSFLFAPARGVLATAWRQARLRLAYAEQAALTSLLHGRVFEARRMAAWLKFRGMVRDGALTPRGQEAGPRR